MAVTTSVLARRYIDVVADQEIAVDYPAYENTDIRILYGKDVLTAVENTDYTLALAGDFNTFTVTVLASLVAKIDALIAADAEEVNAITVRRSLDYLTDATPAGVRRTEFTSREFDRVSMRDLQLSDADDRAVRISEGFVPPYNDVEIKEVPADTSSEPALVFKSGGGIKPGPTTLDLQNAGSNATAAAASAATATTQAATATAQAAAAAASAASIAPFSIIAVTSGPRAIIESDRNALLRTDARYQIDLPNPSALGNGFKFTLDGAGAVLDPNEGTTLTTIGSFRSTLLSTVDTTAALEITPGQRVEVFTDGTDWFAHLVNVSYKHTIFLDPVGSDKNFFDIDVPFGVKAFDYWYDRFLPAVNGAYLMAQIGDLSGVYPGGTDYFTMATGFSSGTGTGSSLAGFLLSEPAVLPTAFGRDGFGSGTFFGFHSANGPRFTGMRGGVIAGPANDASALMGRLNVTGVTGANKVRILCNTGNIDGLEMEFNWRV